MMATSITDRRASMVRVEPTTGREILEAGEKVGLPRAEAEAIARPEGA